MALNDLLARLKDTENPIEDMDVFISDIVAAHESEISVRDAKVDKTLADLAAEREQLKELKVHNYDLIKRIPADKPDGEDKPDEPKVTGINSFFEE